MLAPEVRATALYGAGRGSEAAAVLEPVLAADQPSTRALRLQAQIYTDAGEYRRAVPLLEKAMRLDPHDSLCGYQLAAAYEFLGQRKEAAEQRRRVEETQKLIATMGDLNREASQKPYDQKVRQRLVEVCEQLGKFDLAQSWRRAVASCQVEDESKPSIPK
jgi:tetratricopeptide (TPR) repeat protein